MREFVAKGALFIVAVLLLTSLAWMAVSPRQAVSGLEEAAKVHDDAEIAGRIDLKSIRDALRDRLRHNLTTGGAGSLDKLSEAGADVAMLVADPLVDAAITPASLGQILRREVPNGGKASWEIDRNGLDEFTAWQGGDAAKGERRLGLRFHREGLRWVLREVILP